MDPKPPQNNEIHLITLKTVIYIGIRDSSLRIQLMSLPTTAKHLQRVVIVSIDKQPSVARSLIQYDTDEINEIARIVNNKFQTLTYFGINKLVLKDLVLENSLLGIDRIVPIGQAMDIGVIWDGYDVVRSLSRVLEVK